MWSVASGANDTRRLAKDFLRASRREFISSSSSILSFSSRSRAEACCSSSVRKATLASLTVALPTTWKGFGRLSAPVTVGLGVSAVSEPKSIKSGDPELVDNERFVFGGIVFFGLLVEICAGISRNRGIVGLSIDFGGG